MMHLIYAVFAAFGAAMALALLVWMSGATFGQRCEVAYPGDVFAQDRCVHRLAHGDPL